MAFSGMSPGTLSSAAAQHHVRGRAMADEVGFSVGAVARRRCRAVHAAHLEPAVRHRCAGTQPRAAPAVHGRRHHPAGTYAAAHPARRRASRRGSGGAGQRGAAGAGPGAGHPGRPLRAGSRGRRPSARPARRLARGPRPGPRRARHGRRADGRDHPGRTDPGWGDPHLAGPARPGALRDRRPVPADRRLRRGGTPAVLGHPGRAGQPAVGPAGLGWAPGRAAGLRGRGSSTACRCTRWPRRWPNAR